MGKVVSSIGCDIAFGMTNTTSASYTGNFMSEIGLVQSIISQSRRSHNELLSI